jgi:hypothetical protein
MSNELTRRELVTLATLAHGRAFVVHEITVETHHKIAKTTDARERERLEAIQSADLQYLADLGEIARKLDVLIDAAT